MLTKQELEGNKVSWVNEEENYYVYTTNFGSINVDRDTEEVIYGVISLGRGLHNTRISVKIVDSEFQICKDNLGKVLAEITSPNFPYKLHYESKDFTVSTVLDILIKDNNYSRAAILFKKSLVSLMTVKLKFNKSDKKLLKELNDLLKKSFLPKRIPIITGEK